MNNDYNDYSFAIPKELKGTKTEKNLQDAFAGESKARNNYTFFAEIAKKEGYEIIAKAFEETANNEKEHAKIWLKLLNNGKLKNTINNLETSATTEHYEWQDMYARFALEAKEEGFEEIANLFETIRKIEKYHMQKYQNLIQKIKTNTIFKKDTETTWECANCGLNIENKEPPEICPFCRHPKSYFFEKELC